MILETKLTMRSEVGDTLEPKDIKLSKSKTEYLKCKFNEREEVTIRKTTIPKVKKFKYIDSIVQSVVR